MDLHDLVSQIDTFDKWPTRDKFELFAWFLHVHRRKNTLTNEEIRACFDQLHLRPSRFALYKVRAFNPEDFIIDDDRMRLPYTGRFKLHRSVRMKLDRKFGAHETRVQVSELLSYLPAKVPDLSERDFLAEALRCDRNEAYRSCIVMTWNLTYNHLLDWILKDAGRLASFNGAIPVRYPKKTGVRITKYDDFGDELKESEVIEICGNASLLSGNIKRILLEKLGKRNTAAHPSSVKVVQSQADDVVTDLVNNVVLKLT